MARCTATDHSFDSLKQWIDSGNKISPRGTPLIYSASITGHLDCLKLLLDSGADINACDYSGETALYGASEYGHYDCLMLLLNNGARTIGGSEIYSTSALDIAIIGCHRSCVWALINHGMKFNKKHLLDCINRHGHNMNLPDQKALDTMIADVEQYFSTNNTKKTKN
jgi:ankyrin repeat protein